PLATDGRPRQTTPEDRRRVRPRARRIRMGDRHRPTTTNSLTNTLGRGVAGGPSQKENPRFNYAAPVRGRPATLDRGSSRRTPVMRSPTRECQSDPPSLPRDARHPTPEPPTPTTRRTLTVGSMSVAQPPLTVRPALIARAPQPRVELVLHSPLDDQPSAQPRQLRQRLPGVLTHPYRQHVLDPSLDLRRRRYGTSHGVGPPSIVLSGLEGTYAVASTAPALFTALLRRDH